MVLYFTSMDRVCGSFTSASWDSNGERQSKTDPRAFLFSLDKRLKFPVKKPEYAIFCDKNWGPTFGQSNDLSAKSSPFNRDEQGMSNGAGTSYMQEDSDDDTSNQISSLGDLIGAITK